MDLIPAGQYQAVAVPVRTEAGESWAQFGETKNGNPQVVVNFEILEGEQKGRRISWFGYFTDKTTQRTVESLRYCGFTGNDLAAATYMPLDQEVQIVIDHEEYNGKWSAKVQWVNKAGGGLFKLDKPMDKRGLERFAAQMRGAVAAIPDAPGKKAERAQRPAGSGGRGGTAPRSDGPPSGWTDSAPPPPADDDIPF